MSDRHKGESSSSASLELGLASCSRAIRRVSIGILVITLALVLTILLLRIPGTSLTSDGYLFLVSARNLLDGKGYTVGGAAQLIDSPGYSVPSALLNKLLKNLPMAGLIVSALASTTVVALTWLIVRRWWGYVAGALAVLLVGRFVLLESWARLVGAEPLLAALVLGSVHVASRLMHHDRHATRHMWLLFGFLGGWAYVTKPEGLLVFSALFAIVMVFHSRQPEGWRFRGVARLAALCAAPFLVVGLPWAAFMSYHSDSPTIAAKVSLNLLDGENVTDPNYTVRRYASRHEFADFFTGHKSVSLLTYVSQHRRAVAERILKNLKKLARVLLDRFQTLGWLLITVSVFHLLQSGDGRRTLLLLSGASLLPLISMLIFFIDSRVIGPSMLPFYFLIALSLARIVQVFGPEHQPTPGVRTIIERFPFVQLFLCVALVLILGRPAVDSVRASMPFAVARQSPVEWAAGQLLNYRDSSGNIPEALSSDRVGNTVGAVSYYAGLEPTAKDIFTGTSRIRILDPSLLTVDAVKKEMRRTGVSLFIVFEFSAHHPPSAQLADDSDFCVLAWLGNSAILGIDRRCQKTAGILEERS